MHKMTREYFNDRFSILSDRLACIGGCDADALPAHMILGEIQDQKQKYNLEP